jgi:hypothetical protein
MFNLDYARQDAARFASHMARNLIPHSGPVLGRSGINRKHFADGGAAITGPLISPAGGRTDLLPIKVPHGSYVIPADIVSGMPGAQGSSLAGFNFLNKLFGSNPLSPDKGPYGVSPPDIRRGNTIPLERRVEHHLINPYIHNLPQKATKGYWHGGRESTNVEDRTDMPSNGPLGALDYSHFQQSPAGTPQFHRRVMGQVPSGIAPMDYLSKQMQAQPHSDVNYKPRKGEKEWRGMEPVDILAAGGEYVVPPHHVEHLGYGSLERGHAVLDDFVKGVRKQNIKDLSKLPGPSK